MRRHERGMVTAELATILPFAVAFGLLLLWVVTLGLTQVRLTDAAREGARLVARGETRASATDAARRMAPDGSDVEIDVDDGSVTVRVTVRTRGPVPLLSSVGDHESSASSTAVLEDLP